MTKDARISNHVKDLRGQRFGRLLVRDLDCIYEGAAYWQCDCYCGTTAFVSRGNRLTMGRTVSCGCWRADPAVRQAARLTIPPEERKRLAALGGGSHK